MLHSQCWKAKPLQSLHCLCYGTSQSLLNLLSVNGKHKKAPAATSSSWLPISNSLLEFSGLDGTHFSAAFCPSFPVSQVKQHSDVHSCRGFLPQIPDPRSLCPQPGCSLHLPLSRSQPAAREEPVLSSVSSTGDKWKALAGTLEIKLMVALGSDRFCSRGLL